MSVGGRRRQGSQATRASLLDAARGLFLAHGYEDTSVRMIASAASVTIGAIYGHFGAKRSVLLEVVRAMNAVDESEWFDGPEHRSLVLTVASFAHVDEEAAVVLGEVLRGPGVGSRMPNRRRAGEWLTAIAK